MFQLMSVLPHVNALLNSLSAAFLIIGFVFIRKREIRSHRKCMLTAFLCSVVFLSSYLLYHSLRAYYFHIGPTKFLGQGIIRPVYFTILTTHTFLAVLVVPFILVAVWRALHSEFEKHRKIAVWTFPIWLYVSVTGVVVYVMLYHLYPAG
jgi:uncharacterized membrane protein YozB (DUF420 family)